jgi:hypothetical protein
VSSLQNTHLPDAVITIESVFIKIQEDVTPEIVEERVHLHSRLWAAEQMQRSMGSQQAGI